MLVRTIALYTSILIASLLAGCDSEVSNSPATPAEVVSEPDIPGVQEGIIIDIIVSFPSSPTRGDCIHMLSNMIPASNKTWAEGTVVRCRVDSLTADRLRFSAARVGRQDVLQLADVRISFLSTTQVPPSLQPCASVASHLLPYDEDPTAALGTFDCIYTVPLDNPATRASLIEVWALTDGGAPWDPTISCWQIAQYQPLGVHVGLGDIPLACKF